MKILKIFGIVVGIHVFALILIFANPGCSSTATPPPIPNDTAAPSSPSIQTSDTTPMAPTSAPSLPSSSSPGVTFNPDAPAGPGAGGTRYTPTRPGSPVATTLVAEPVADVQPTTTYTVKSGDSLWTIAKKHHLTVAQLAAANSLKSNSRIQPGQKLLIPGQPSSPTAAATANPAVSQGKTAETIAVRPSPTANGSVKHVVKQGETLGAIARNYGVRTGDIAVANNIVDPAKIRPGTELVIPGWEAPGSKSGKATKSGKSAPASTKAPSSQQQPSTQPASNSEPPPLPTPQSQVPVIRIDEGPSPIVPAPR